MHVALFSPAWPLASYPNGIVTYAHLMREELRRQGHRVTLLTASLKTAEDDVYEVKTSLRSRAGRWLSMRREASNPAIFGWGTTLAENFRQLHRQAPIDVIEMEESFGWAGEVERGVPIPVVVKLHGPAFLSLVEEEVDSDSGRLKIEREGIGLRECRFITSPSRKTLQQTVHRYHLAPEIARHIVNPISLPASAPLWQLDKCRHDTVLFVGRFDKRKGGDLILRAFASLLRTKPWMHLIFVGPNAGLTAPGAAPVYFDELMESLFSKEVATQVDFRGVLNPADIYALRAQALVTVVASRWENHSYTALEAMLQGCPVVSSDAGGQPEFIVDGSSGLLARAGDAEDLCAKIRLLIESPELAAAIGQEARRYVVENHHAALVVKQTVSTYSEAIELTKNRKSASKSKT